MWFEFTNVTSGEVTTVVLLEDPNGAAGTDHAMYDYVEGWDQYWMGVNDSPTEQVFAVDDNALPSDSAVVLDSTPKPNVLTFNGATSLASGAGLADTDSTIMMSFMVRAYGPPCFDRFLRCSPICPSSGPTPTLTLLLPRTARS